MDDHIRTGEVQSGAAGLETHEEDGDVAVLVKPAHHILPVLGAAVQIAVRQVALLHLRPQDGQHRGKLAEHEHTMLTVQRFVEEFKEELHLGRRMVALDPFEPEQVDMVAGLPQPEQRLEDLHPALVEAVFFHHVGNLLFRILQQLRINLMLVLRQLARGNALDLGRQILGHLLLETPQQEGMQFAAQVQLGMLAVRTAVCDRQFILLMECLVLPQVARHQEIHDGPQIVHAVFNGCPGQHQPVEGLDLLRRKGVLRRAVLDVLRFVQYGDCIGVFEVLFDIAAHQGIGSDDQIGLFHLLPFAVAVRSV